MSALQLDGISINLNPNMQEPMDSQVTLIVCVMVAAAFINGFLYFESMKQWVLQFLRKDRRQKE